MSIDNHEYVNVMDGVATCVTCGKSWSIHEIPPPCPEAEHKRLEKIVDRIFYAALVVTVLWIMFAAGAK